MAYAIPIYLSAEKYSEKSGLGVEEVKKKCRNGEIKCERTGGGHYKILVYNDVLFDVSGDVMPEILQRTNLSKTIPIASHVTNLDDYYVWRYQYNSEDGFRVLHSPFD